MIDAKGLMITNAHVVKNSKNIAVQNSKGADYVANAVYIDKQRDVAIIKIEDDKFKPLASLPYRYSKTFS